MFQMIIINMKVTWFAAKVGPKYTAFPKDRRQRLLKSPKT